jgi:hypothetical protein
MKIYLFSFLTYIFSAFFPVMAHHGVGDFDHDQEIEISGAITKIRFVNPHSWLYLDVTTEGGDIEAWQCELRSATILKRSGWSKEMFVAGEAVHIKGSPARRKSRTCYITTITFANGESYNRYDQIGKEESVTTVKQPERLTNGDPNINGDWAGEQYVLTDASGASGAFVPLSVAEDIRSGERSADDFLPFPGTRGFADAVFDNKWQEGLFTEAGEQVLKNYIPKRDNPRWHCQPTSIINDWIFDAEVNRIIQTEETITLLYGFMDMQRTIHLNMDSHPDKLIPSRTGHSIGRWEDDILIVDTTGFESGFLDGGSAKWRATPHSSQLNVIEKFYLNDDRTVLTREYIAEDMVYLNRPFADSDQLLRSDHPYEKPVCEDVYFTDIE